MHLLLKRGNLTQRLPRRLRHTLRLREWPRSAVAPSLVLRRPQSWCVCELGREYVSVRDESNVLDGQVLPFVCYTCAPTCKHAPTAWITIDRPSRREGATAERGKTRAATCSVVLLYLCLRAHRPRKSLQQPAMGILLWCDHFRLGTRREKKNLVIGKYSITRVLEGYTDGGKSVYTVHNELEFLP